MTPTTLSHTPLVLVIRDGWGRNPHPAHEAFDAISRAKTPVDARLARDWPTTLIRTCGEDVGLPPGTMGNSEVGHQTIGAGRIVHQELMRITNAIRDGVFARNDELRAAFAHAQATGGRVHLLGLVSDGQVHSDLPHLFALVELAAAQGLPGSRLLVHAITDGRDTAPTTGIAYVAQLEAKLREAGVGRIATVIGRYWAMDRDRRWDRVARAYACLASPGPGGGFDHADSAADALRAFYAAPPDPGRHGDEFVTPTRIGADDAVRAGDAVIFFNFRGDRPREITKAFVLDDAAWAAVTGGGFERGPRIDDLHFTTMTSYETGLPVHVAFERPPAMDGILGAVLETLDVPQFRCAETEKFPHVTYFFNDYREEPFRGERRVLLPSPRDVPTYDLAPAMSAPGVCAAVLEWLADPAGAPVGIVNFANADMVGHTGKLDATILAVEVVDECVGRIVDALLARGGCAIVTADHGNAEQMWDPETETPHTAHTVYDVPLTIVGEGFAARSLRTGGRLGDIAPTMLTMLGLEPPAPMTGESLLA